MKISPKNYAIVPTYNEEENIEEILSRLKTINITPLVVDDKSSDRTVEIAEKSRVKVLKHEVNKGKGEAIKTGINYLLENTGFDHLILIDADMQYSPEEATNLLQALKKGKADIVTGYRSWSTIPFRHRLGNFVWRTSFNILFGTNFKDTNCGFMALSREAADKLRNALYGGYIIENSIFTQALRDNMKINQVPVSVQYKKTSKISRGVRVVAGVLIFILKEGIKYRLRIGKSK